MPALLNTYINNTLSRYNSWRYLVDDIYNSMLSASSSIDAAGDFLIGNSPTNAGISLKSAAGALLNCYSYMQQQLQYTLSWNGTGEYWLIKALQWINTNWTGTGASVDMDAIINAMLAAKFNQLEKFIGIEDAYRVALWTAPFNADFYAALARGFAKWPEP